MSEALPQPFDRPSSSIIIHINAAPSKFVIKICFGGDFTSACAKCRRVSAEKDMYPKCQLILRFLRLAVVAVVAVTAVAALKRLPRNGRTVLPNRRQIVLRAQRLLAATDRDRPSVSVCVSAVDMCNTQHTCVKRGWTDADARSDGGRGALIVAVPVVGGRASGAVPCTFRETSDCTVGTRG